jgi:hypothetical protein
LIPSELQEYRHLGLLILTLYSDIDHQHFVLNVDLWSASGVQEINLVKHSSQSPAISSTIPTSYAQTQAGDNHAAYINPQLPTPTGPPSIVRDPQYPYHFNQPGSQAQYNPATVPTGAATRPVWPAAAAARAIWAKTGATRVPQCTARTC